MWSSGRSEALSRDRAAGPHRSPANSRCEAAAVEVRRGERHAQVDVPDRTSRRAALAWALDQRQWIEAQLARALPAEPFEAGAVIPVEGVETLIVWSEREPRTPSLMNGELRCGGPQAGLARRVEAFLKRQAIEMMSREVAEFAIAAGATCAGR